MVWSWDSNSEGQLGDTTRAQHLTPTRVPGLSNVVALDGGDRHSLAQRADGTVWTWGANNHGQLGDPTLASHLTPFQVVLP